MKIEELKEYIHSDWSETAECRNDKYYFVRTDADELEDVFAEIKYQLSEEVPDDLKRFYKEVGFGFLWFGFKQKKGIYKRTVCCTLGCLMGLFIIFPQDAKLQIPSISFLIY